MNGLWKHCKFDIKLGQFLIYIVISSAITSALIFFPAQYSILAAVGALALAITAARPEIGILMITILISSIVFTEELPLIPIGIGSIHISDILLTFMLAMIIYKRLFNSKFKLVATPLDLPLGIFILASITSAFISIVIYGNDFNEVIRILRFITYYLLFFVVTNLIREKKQVDFLVKSLLFIAVIVSMAMLLQAVLGESVKITPGRVETATTFEQAYKATRVLPPGRLLVFVLLISAICSVISTHLKPLYRSGYFYLTMIFGVGVVLTYNRSYWLAAFICLGILFLRISGEGRIRMVYMTASITVVSVILFLCLASFGLIIEGNLSSISNRFSSLFSAKELGKSTSVKFRIMENEYAFQQIVKHPIIGIGLHNDYRPPGIYGRDDSLTRYIHNSYLYILTDIGLIGLMSYLWFYFGFIIRNIRRCASIEDHKLKYMIEGFAVAAIGTLFIAVVDSMFLEWFSVVTLSTIAGLSEVAVTLNDDINQPVSTN